MTRLTKMARKTHEEASEFVAKPLLPVKADPSSTPTPSSTTTTDKSNKRKATDDASAPKPATAAEGTEGGKASEAEPEQKKKKMRHRKKEAGAGDDAAVAGAGKGGNTAGRKTGGAGPGGRELSKQEKEALRRRTRRERNKEKKMVCFLCRNLGHSINSCPKATETEKNAPIASDGAVVGICYKCGSGEHKSSQCRKLVDPKNPYPFAHCFVCNKNGHLASACSENERGLYPNGGGCKFCGSVRHFARDCKPALQEAGVTTVGKIDLRQGGDDDDVFVALHRMDEDKTQRRAAAAAAKTQVSATHIAHLNSKSDLPPQRPAAVAPTAAAVPNKARPAKKKVVKF
ncbi:uncharacterized protein EV422DRAFT_535663 [Fimicolochytrium jonesii]|uniref:uncharacterized protein n=1 Tax=Fimicolochytrium jonesii TaxID=1396493 RepID=UPI0022FDE4F2|nr:uncharacterized protein EV422DRAFT_535663 [Fimicolochytrium jonesii]KAI8819239.1 hypothetical protein EV422DRAFT_535663 [Fimicolochytrium jonesii]